MEFQFGYTIEDTAKVIGAIYKSLNWYYIIRRPRYFIPPLTYILQSVFIGWLYLHNRSF